MTMLIEECEKNESKYMVRLCLELGEWQDSQDKRWSKCRRKLRWVTLKKNDKKLLKNI